MAHTIAQLKKMNSNRLVKVYTQVTGREWFNPFVVTSEDRQDMMIEILGRELRNASPMPTAEEVAANVATVNRSLKNLVEGQKAVKLTERDVRIIRRAVADGESISRIVKVFGISQMFVRNIVAGKVYKYA